MGHRTDKARTEDMTTDQRANRHPAKSADYLEEAQGVRNDNLTADIQPLNDDESTHARNKANENQNKE